MIQAIIFDLDGVIVSTDEFHYQAWKQLASSNGIPFSRDVNERLRGVSRMESLEIILEQTETHYSAAEKERMAANKNTLYRESLTQLNASDILPGVSQRLRELRSLGIKIAIGSSSKNAQPILEAIGLDHTFDAIADGTHITHSKPNPEVFLLAAQKLNIPVEHCLVVEDAHAGVDAARAANMPVLAVGAATTHPLATLKAEDLSQISIQTMLSAHSITPLIPI